MNLAGALQPIQGDLQAVSDRIASALSEPVARMVVYLISAGGKRLRPALVLLAGAGATARGREGLLDTAAAVELIHTATLIHDDIIDQSGLRRQQRSFHHRWGTERAVLMGDYLYATAFTMLAQARQPDVTAIMAQVCRQLSRGELREVAARFRLDLTEAEYFDIIRDKTASLTEGCCRSGACLAGADPQAVERWGAFGMNFGMAFQIMDDCLDLTGDPRELGKSILADLDRGALSLPIIYLARRLSPSARQRLFAPLRRRARDPRFLRRVAAAAQSYGAIAKATAKAREFSRMAQAALEGVSLDGVGHACRQLAHYAVSRRS